MPEAYCLGHKSFVTSVTCIPSLEKRDNDDDDDAATAAAAATSGQRRAVSGGGDGTLRMWDCATGKLLETISLGDGVAVSESWVSADARLLAVSAVSSKIVWIIDMSGAEGMRILRTMEVDGNVIDCTFAGADGTVPIASVLLSSGVVGLHDGGRGLVGYEAFQVALK